MKPLPQPPDAYTIGWASQNNRTIQTELARVDAIEQRVYTLESATYIDLDEIAEPAAPSANTARLYAVDRNGVTEVEFKDSTGLVHTVGEELSKRVRNSTGVTITKGQAVYITGSTGSTPTIALARSDAEATLPCTGLALEDIANNGFGRVINNGVLSGIDTSAFVEGDVLWVSAASAGALVNTAPVYPNWTQKIGTVTNSGVGNGSILVEVGGVSTSAGATGRELHSAATPAAARTTLGVTATGADTTYAYRANNLSDLANAATARTNLGLGTIATQSAAAVAITGGTVNGTSVGATTPSTGAFTTLSATGTASFNGGSLGSAGTPSVALPNGRLIVWQNAAGTANQHWIYAWTDDKVYFGALGAERMVLSSTGLAVTGALSATGAITGSSTITAAKSFQVDDVHALTAVTSAAQTRTYDVANGADQTLEANQAFTLAGTNLAGKRCEGLLYVYNNGGATFTMTAGAGITFSVARLHDGGSSIPTNDVFSGYTHVYRMLNTGRNSGGSTDAIIVSLTAVVLGDYRPS